MLNALQYKHEPYDDCGKGSSLSSMRGKCRYIWDHTKTQYFRHFNNFVDGEESYGSCSDATGKSCTDHWIFRDS